MPISSWKGDIFCSDIQNNSSLMHYAPLTRATMRCYISWSVSKKFRLQNTLKHKCVHQNESCLTRRDVLWVRPNAHYYYYYWIFERIKIKPFTFKSTYSKSLTELAKYYNGGRDYNRISKGAQSFFLKKIGPLRNLGDNLCDRWACPRDRYL